MNKFVRYTGKLRLIERRYNENYSEYCKRACFMFGLDYYDLPPWRESYEDVILCELEDKIMIHNYKLYEKIDQKRIFSLQELLKSEKSGEEIMFDIQFDSDLKDINEAIDEALNNIKFVK